MKSEKTHVLVVVPTFDRFVTVDIAETAMHLAHLEAATEFQFEFGSVVGALGHEFARNRCVGLLKQYPKTDKVLWLDADVRPDPYTTIALLRVEADIASCVYPGFGEKGLLFQIYDKYDPETGMFTTWYPKVDDPMVLDIAGCGFGYVATDRKVLDDPRMQLPRQWTTHLGKSYDEPQEPGLPCVFQFERDSAGKIRNGEDLNFCFRAKQLGYSIKALLRSPDGRHILAGHIHRQDYFPLFEFLSGMQEQAFFDGVEHGKRIAIEGDGDVTAYQSGPVTP